MKKIFIVAIFAFIAFHKSNHAVQAQSLCTSSLHMKYDCKLKKAVDKQINRDLEAFYFYLRVGNFFAHEDYYLPGLSKFLSDAAQEKMKHAQKMIDFQIKRGAHVVYSAIDTTPSKTTWNNATEALEDVLDLEKNVTDYIEKLHTNAQTDKHLQDFLKTNFIPEQYNSMKLISNHLKTLKRLTNGGCSSALAEFQFDKLVLQGLKSST